MPRLTSAERDAFLQERGILCRIATIDDEGAPHVTPIWFIHHEGAVVVTPRKNSAWLEHIRHDNRVAITIDEEASPYRKVALQGRAEFLFDIGRDDEWRDLYRAIAKRYVPEAGAEHYVQETIDQPRALLAIPLAGAKVQTWRMPRQGEEYAGIWHQRYYVPGSKLANE